MDSGPRLPGTARSLHDTEDHETSTLSHRTRSVCSDPTAPGAGCPTGDVATDQSSGRPDGGFDTIPEHRHRRRGRQRRLRRGHRTAVGPGPVARQRRHPGHPGDQRTVDLRNDRRRDQLSALPGHGHRPRRRVAQPSHQRHRIGRANPGADRQRPAHRIPGRPDHRGTDRGLPRGSPAVSPKPRAFAVAGPVPGCDQKPPPSTGRRTSSPATASPATARPPSRNARPAPSTATAPPPDAPRRSDRTANRARLKRRRTRSR